MTYIRVNYETATLIATNVAVVALFVAFAAGYVMNIIQLVAIASGPVTTLVVLKALGIFLAPLGALLGWIG